MKSPWRGTGQRLSGCHSDPPAGHLHLRGWRYCFGLYDCDFGTNPKTALLVDLGTNGEMAIGNCERIITTSTAAGPAFEGGNISWGMGSVQGAICNVKIQDGKAKVTTIGDKPPVGLCGTGVIETMAELIEHEYVDETGRLEDEYFDEGFETGKDCGREKNHPSRSRMCGKSSWRNPPFAEASRCCCAGSA